MEGRLVQGVEKKGKEIYKKNYVSVGARYLP